MRCIAQYALYMLFFLSGFRLKVGTLQYLNYKLIIIVDAHVVQVYICIVALLDSVCTNCLSGDDCQLSGFDKCENLVITVKLLLVK
jgi:hypothetical protein